MSHGRLDAGQWSSYWQRGTFHSLPGLFPENYAGPVSRFWHAVFSRLPADARVLDLGTGNGAPFSPREEWNRPGCREPTSISS